MTDLNPIADALSYYVDVPEGGFNDRFLSWLERAAPADLLGVAKEFGWSDTEAREGLVSHASKQVAGLDWPTYGDGVLLEMTQGRFRQGYEKWLRENSEPM